MDGSVVGAFTSGAFEEESLGFWGVMIRIFEWERCVALLSHGF